MLKVVGASIDFSCVRAVPLHTDGDADDEHRWRQDEWPTRSEIFGDHDEYLMPLSRGKIPRAQRSIIGHPWLSTASHSWS